MFPSSELFIFSNSPSRSMFRFSHLRALLEGLYESVFRRLCSIIIISNWLDPIHSSRHFVPKILSGKEYHSNSVPRNSLHIPEPLWRIIRVPSSILIPIIHDSVSSSIILSQKRNSSVFIWPLRIPIGLSWSIEKYQIESISRLDIDECNSVSIAIRSERKRKNSPIFTHSWQYLWERFSRFSMGFSSCFSSGISEKNEMHIYWSDSLR